MLPISHSISDTKITEPEEGELPGELPGNDLVWAEGWHVQYIAGETIAAAIAS